eukprot:gene3970-biopygen2461
MSKLLEEASLEAHKTHGENIPKQIRYIGNAFLNAIEISAQEAVYLVMQMPLKRSSRAIQFINTAPANERCFLIKSSEKINDLADSSTDVESDNVIQRYQRRPQQLEDICLADFVAWYEALPSGKYDSLNSMQIWSDYLPHNDSFENHDDDTVIEDDIVSSSKTYKLPGKLELVKRSKAKVLRSIRYDKNKDPENHYRERLMLYMPWRNETCDILQDSQTFEENFPKNKRIIDKNCRQYETDSAAFEYLFEDASYDVFNEPEIVAPGAQHIDDDDFQRGTQASKLYGCFDQGPSANLKYD